MDLRTTCGLASEKSLVNVHFVSLFSRGIDSEHFTEPFLKTVLSKNHILKVPEIVDFLKYITFSTQHAVFFFFVCDSMVK